MPDAWLSISEAATALRVHTRTIERRIASGKINARRTPDGALQVLVDQPDKQSDPSPETAAFETVRELAADQVNLATGSASALVKFAQDEADRARDELAFVRQQATRSQRSAVTAWLAVALLGIGVTVAVGWTASQLTRANADVRQQLDRTRQLETETKSLIAERDQARNDANQAAEARAEASGKLAAYVEQHQKQLEILADRRPATQPANLIQRIASAFTPQQ